MLLTTTERQIHSFGLRTDRRAVPPSLARFHHPHDVLDEAGLAPADKRAILASWLSDASAVKDQPQLRWLLGTPAPVTVSEIREALLRLDLEDGLQ